MKRPVFLVVFSLLVITGFGGTSPLLSSSDQKEWQEIERLFEIYKKSFPRVPDLTAEAVSNLQREGDVLLVDVRGDYERKVSMIPGAISKKELKEKLKNGNNRKVVAYCTIGVRSGSYAKKMRKKGFDVYNLKGGILAWTHARKPLVNERGPTKSVHVYGPKWNLLPEGYQAIW